MIESTFKLCLHSVNDRIHDHFGSLSMWPNVRFKSQFHHIMSCIENQNLELFFSALQRFKLRSGWRDPNTARSVDSGQCDGGLHT